MAERLNKIDPRMRRRVATDPSGIMPLSDEYPFGTRCHLTELGPEGTFGIIVFIPHDGGNKRKS